MAGSGGKCDGRSDGRTDRVMVIADPRDASASKNLSVRFRYFILRCLVNYFSTHDSPLHITPDNMDSHDILELA